MAKGGKQPGAGRPKGMPNKVTKALKEMILGALEQAGGEQYLFTQAHDNQNAFLSLIGRILPTEVKAEHTCANGTPLEIVIVPVRAAHEAKGSDT